MIGGITLSFYYPFNFKPVLLYFLALIASWTTLSIYFLKLRNNGIYLMLFAFAFFLIGILSGTLNDSSKNSTYFFDGRDAIYLAEIIDQPIEKKGSYQITANILQDQKKTTTGKGLIYLEKSAKSRGLNFGDRITVLNRFQPITKNRNPYEFDYQRYSKIHDLHHQTYLENDQWELQRKGWTSFFSLIASVRLKLENWISHSSLNAQNKKIAKALFLGQKEFLDKSILKSFSSAGAMHVLAVSGLHVGIVMLILQFLLKPIKRFKRGRFIYPLFIVSGVWLYALLTGFSPSVIRAALMFSFIIFGMALERQNSIYQSIFASAFLILVFDPFSLFKVGFQLSYLAVLGIVYFQPKIYKLIHVKQKAIDYLWQITSVSIAAQLATFPLGLYYFHQFPNLFLISNIIVIPLAGILLSLGVIYFTFHFVTPIKIVLESILNVLFSILNAGVEWIENIPYSIAWGISIHWLEVFVIYGLIINFSASMFYASKKIFFASMGGVLIFLGIQNYEKNIIANQIELTCYNIKKDFALDFFQGSENLFISTKKLVNNNSKLQFHIKYHWFHKRGNLAPSKQLDIDSLINPVLKIGNNMSLCIINSDRAPIPITNYIILYRTRYLEPSILKHWEKNRAHLVIHPDLPYSVANFCKRNYPLELIYDIKNEGAFQLSCK